MVTEELRQAVAALEIKPRGAVWTSLSYCVLDAVWSIGARYDSVVVPLVRGVASAHGDDTPTAPSDGPIPADPLPLDAFLSSYPDVGALSTVTNAQRTSTRSGILKADAALRYAAILQAHGLTARVDAHQALSEPPLVDDIDRELAGVPGDGVRRPYLWMLVGSNDRVKPDRMILRFLGRYGGPTTTEAAHQVLTELARDLTTESTSITPWMIDHAIWRAERTRRPGRKRATGRLVT